MKMKEIVIIEKNRAHGELYLIESYRDINALNKREWRFKPYFVRGTKADAQKEAKSFAAIQKVIVTVYKSDQHLNRWGMGDIYGIQTKTGH